MNRLHGFGAATTLAGNIDIAFLGQDRAQAFAGERLVVDDEDADRVHVGCEVSGPFEIVRAGSSMSTTTPPDSGARIVSFPLKP